MIINEGFCTAYAGAFEGIGRSDIMKSILCLAWIGPALLSKRVTSLLRTVLKKGDIESTTVGL